MCRHFRTLRHNKPWKVFTYSQFPTRGAALPHPDMATLLLISEWGDLASGLGWWLERGWLDSRIVPLTDDQALQNLLEISLRRIVWQIYYFPWARNCGPLEKNPRQFFFCFLCYAQEQVSPFSINIKKKQDSWTKELEAGLGWCCLFSIGSDMETVQWPQHILLGSSDDNLIVSFISLKLKVYFLVGPETSRLIKGFCRAFFTVPVKGEMISNALRGNIGSKEKWSQCAYPRCDDTLLYLSWWWRTKVLFSKIKWFLDLVGWCLSTGKISWPLSRLGHI